MPISPRVSLLLSLLTGLLLTAYPLPAEPAKGFSHPFLQQLHDNKTDGVMVLLPPSPEAAAPLKALITEQAVQALIPNGRVLLINPETKTPAEQDLVKYYFLGNYATTLLVDSNGRPYVSELGIPSSAPALTKFLTDGLALRKKRNELFAKWNQTPGVAGVPVLTEALGTLPPSYLSRFYSTEIEQLISVAGKDSETGKKYESLLSKQRREIVINEILSATASRTGPDDTALDFIRLFDEEVGKRNLPVDALQLAEMHRFRLFANAKRFEDALKALEKAEKMAPETALAKNIPAFKERMKSALQKQKNEEQARPEGGKGNAEKKGENP